MDFMSGVTGSHLFNMIMIPVQLIIIFMTFYYFVLSMFGLFRRPDKKVLEPEKSFALVVAAHNEEAVIGPLVDNLLNLDYPKELYDVFVVADNCTDKTALIAKNAGALVHQRFNNEKRGKGYALEWMFHRLFKLERHYDAVIIFDADNLVNETFLVEMNSKLCQGHQIVQCYLDSKNPYDTWVTNTFSITFWLSNRLLQLARYNTGFLNNVLGGTGMCISTKVLKDLGWGATSLTEDLEFTMKALISGIKTTWAHDAIVYDEKPLTFIQAWNQRKRWAQGQVDVAGRYFFPLIYKAFKERKLMYFDAAVHLFQPALVMIATFFMFVNLISGLQSSYTQVFNVVMPWSGWQILSAFSLVFPVAALALERLPWRAYAGLILYPVFIYSWIPIVFLGFVNRKDKSWSHTKHTRSIKYDDVVKEKKVSSS
ncbi:cellulose synthase/poly-beta-1,6-N-acetylglucosamine synthase-like glycosyltransferase [Desulfitobacterium sp. LBE]|nr:MULTISPECIES: glycosyltransferase family 2 protein [Desulfitobacterium]ACL18245.1 glycosyl transferase family 2 [Desulfitobacterium hafniense DCB-2]EHL09026.1 glycosyltransferase, group 2 family protein [Desulfitobacterium hafniense DP7]KTE92301.1 glycosyl transferase family 2 [Desulfitobacterium hafniense]MEA5024384.1 glycosyltransferase family 2 protein [Desulfitobacterium hafniense]TWH58837.1 cellulose synthase/poly-beta-1,6-N-acetylglucosamine synthase-like glycosyltransferase [Desulfit